MYEQNSRFEKKYEIIPWGMMFSPVFFWWEEEEEEEESLFRADAVNGVNEEDPERDRATQEEEEKEELFVFIGYCRGTQSDRC